MKWKRKTESSKNILLFQSFQQRVKNEIVWSELILTISPLLENLFSFQQFLGRNSLHLMQLLSPGKNSI